MLINKLPILEQTQSTKLFNKQKLNFENANYGDKFYKQSNILKPKRQMSIIKTSNEVRKLIQSTTDESITKKLIQNKIITDTQNNDKIIQEQEQKYYDQIRLIEDFKLENIKLKMQIEEQEQQIIYLKLINSDLRQQLENTSSTIQLKKIEQEYKETYKRMDETLRKAIDENYESQLKIKNLHIKSQQLEQFTFILKQQLTCRFCRKELNNTITVIPCAHNYCQRCVQGYIGKCYACNDEVKVQTTYHNEYMSDIINMYKIFENILNILKN